MHTRAAPGPISEHATDLACVDVVHAGTPANGLSDLQRQRPAGLCTARYALGGVAEQEDAWRRVDTAASIMPSMLADPFGLSIIGVQRLGNQVWASTGKCHRALAQRGKHAIDHHS